MASAYRTGEACPRCGSGSTTSQGECLACGALWGPDFLCPHCGEHTRPVSDPLVGASCSDCGKPRLGVSLPKEAYGRVLDRMRFARLWHARVLVYLPVVALVAALFVAGADFYWKGAALHAHDVFVAERGPAVPPPTSLAPVAPEPPVAFVAALLAVGIVGLGIYVGVGAALRARVRSEAARLEAMATAPGSTAR